jgi:L-2-hydroxycarboxylate dehydrogenase (NAD+)
VDVLIYKENWSERSLRSEKMNDMASERQPVFPGETARFDPERLRQFTREVFERLDVPPADAAIAADILIEADLRGFNSHGMARLFPCYMRLKQGIIQKRPEISIAWLTAATGHCDGGNGLGMVVGWHAMNACLARAKETGAAFLAVRRSNHFGIAGYYASMAREHDMIGVAMTNASPRVVPTGGSTGVLGTNPISVSFPGGEGASFLLDMSTSAVSSGKIDVVLRKGEEVPEGWVYPSVQPFLDSEGVAPMSVLQYPLGGRKKTSGYKGYGLGMMVDIFAGVLSGANFGTLLASSKKPDAEADIGHFFGAFKLSGFRKKDAFQKDLSRLVDDLRSSPTESGVEKIFIPGEPEEEHRRENLKKGIPVLPPVLEKLRRIALELDLKFSG